MLSVVLSAYVAILAAEVVGDKLCWSVTVLSARQSPSAVVAGVSLALVSKTAVALLLGRALATLPAWTLRLAGVLTFGWLALAWLVERDEPVASARPARSGPAAVLGAFTAVFFSEWGDVGQIALATLAARSEAPWAVGLGALLAYATKAAGAFTLGSWLRRCVPPRPLRGLALVLCVVLALATGLGVEP